MTGVRAYGDERIFRELADLVAAHAGRQPGRARIHPATRTFQAIRIALNDELGALERGLEQYPRNAGIHFNLACVESLAGRADAAFEHLRRAIALDDALPYDEPWGWMQPTRHAYGALLLEQDRVEEAETVYAEDLGYDPSIPRSSSRTGSRRRWGRWSPTSTSTRRSTRRCVRGSTPTSWYPRSCRA